MSIEDSESVDSASISEATGEVVLTISDPLDWTDERAHFLILEKKVNAYLGFIESGRLSQSMPEAQDRRVKIALYQQHAPPPRAVEGLEALGRFLGTRKVTFTHGVGAAPNPGEQ